MTINAFFIIYKGAKGLGLDKTPLGVAFGAAFGIGGLSALITIPIVPKLKNYVQDKFGLDNHKITNVEMENKLETNQIEFNIKGEFKLQRVTDLHNNAEKFDNRTEGTFKYLQIFTAICDAFSHGANDVANAIGPFVTIYTIYNSGGVLDKKADMGQDAYWILALGGVGIACWTFYLW